MTKLIDMLPTYIDDNYEQKSHIFDMKKIKKDFGYCPFYDYVIQYCKENNVGNLRNNGITCFDYRADLSKHEIEDILKEKYKEYLL